MRRNRPLRKYRYVAFKQTYEDLGDGTVRVVCDDGASGVFHVDGRYISGDLTQANTHMLIWTAGPDLPIERRYKWTELPVDIAQPSGWPANLQPVRRKTQEP